MYNASQYPAIPNGIFLHKLQRKVVQVTNTETANHRFAQVIDEIGLSQVALSQLIGLSQSYISQLKSGSRKITVKILQSIAKKIPRINAGWVLTGDGEMFLDNYYKLLPSAEESEKVNDTGAVYNESGEPLEMLRLWMASFESRIKALEAEVRELRDEWGREGKGRG